MNMFNELNDNEEIKVPADLEAKVAARSTYRLRKQRVIAGGLSVLLVLLVSSVAYASIGSSGVKDVNTTDKNKSERLNKISDDQTSTTLIDGTESTIPSSTLRNQNDSSDDNEDEFENEEEHGSTVPSSNSGSTSTSRITSTSTPTTTDDHSDDDSEDDNSGPGSDSSGRDHAEDD